MFRQHMPWVNTCIHPEVHGCIIEHDLADVAWDAQADNEAALTQGKDLVTFLLDYVKLVDMFHPDWVRDFLIHTGSILIW